MALRVRGREPSSVFGLSGVDENSASMALGWVLEHCMTLRASLIETVFGEKLDVAETLITLQRHSEDGGYTDLELRSERDFHAIIEAKVGWTVPSRHQLERYRPRFEKSGAEHRRLISVSAADPAEAERRLPRDVDGVPVMHLSWRQLQTLARQAMARTSTIREKHWLSHLIDHLTEFTAMDRATDNKVFVVALGQEPMVKGKRHTWIDVVTKDRSYFHPIGNNWPPQPPTYIGFRYDGKLQSVHHIDSYEIVRDLSKVDGQWPKTTDDHFVYKLGPAMRPSTTVKTGKIYMNGRVWCAIDTLLSGAFATISAARDETKRRLEGAF